MNTPTGRKVRLRGSPSWSSASSSTSNGTPSSRITGLLVLDDASRQLCSEGISTNDKKSSPRRPIKTAAATYLAVVRRGPPKFVAATALFAAVLLFVAYSGGSPDSSSVDAIPSTDATLHVRTNRRRAINNRQPLAKSMRSNRLRLQLLQKKTKTFVAKNNRPKKTTPVPDASLKTFHIDTSHPIERPVARAMRMNGWRRVEKMSKAQVIYSYTKKSGRFKKLKPWQRYNHIPNHSAWNHKDTFHYFMQRYEKESGKTVWTLPETYRLTDAEETKTFIKRLEKEGGLNSPWVLKKPKVNQGKGITMLGPNTPELKSVVKDVTKELEEDGENAPQYIIQKYICREMTINRRKFDFRVFWMVASLDPLVVLYHDGYVRIGNSEYSEANFADTKAHLTTHTGLAAEGKGTWEALREVVNDHYTKEKANNSNLRSIKVDPMQHIENQVKEALAQMAAAFQEPTFHTRDIGRAENGFGVYGADFIMDEDLDVWFIEPQNGCGLDEDWQFRIDMHNSILGDMINVVDEVAERQEKLLSLDGLQRLGKYEVVYNNGWMYEYEGYKRSNNKKGCELAPSSGAGAAADSAKPKNAKNKWSRVESGREESRL